MPKKRNSGKCDRISKSLKEFHARKQQRNAFAETPDEIFTDEIPADNSSLHVDSQNKQSEAFHLPTGFFYNTSFVQSHRFLDDSDEEDDLFFGVI